VLFISNSENPFRGLINYRTATDEPAALHYPYFFAIINNEILALVRADAWYVVVFVRISGNFG
jgi:hypothetical protein